MKFEVIGTGLVGNAIVKDLAEESGFEIIAADIDKNAIESLQRSTPVEVVHADLLDNEKLKREKKSSPFWFRYSVICCGSLHARVHQKQITTLR